MSVEPGGSRLPVLIVYAGPTEPVLALEFDRRPGIADAVVEGGVRVEAANLWSRGEGAARVPLGRIGGGPTPLPFVLAYPRDAHERPLIEVRVVWSTADR